MKRAFTLVELLVITALICLLAAAAYPMLRATAESIPDQSVRHMKNLGTSTLMYVNDWDDIFPLAAVVRPDGTKLLGTGLPYPFPASSCATGAFQGWHTPQRQNMAASYWANAIFPYGLTPADYSIFGISSYKVPTDDPKLGPLYLSVATFNGELHHYPLHSVAAPSVLPLFWTGDGNVNLNGRAFAMPVMDCGGTIDDCTFNPNGMPSASGHTTFGSTAYGDSISYPLVHQSFWIFGNNRMPISRVDSSAAMVPVGNVIYPTVAPPGTAFSFPFSSVAPDGGPGDVFNGPGQLSYYSCNARGVDLAPSNTNVAYWCFFRPDRTQTIRPNMVRPQ